MFFSFTCLDRISAVVVFSVGYRLCLVHQGKDVKIQYDFSTQKIIATWFVHWSWQYLVSVALCGTPAVQGIWKVVIKKTQKTEFSWSDIVTSWTQGFVTNLWPRTWVRAVVSLYQHFKAAGCPFLQRHFSNPCSFLKFWKFVLWNPLLEMASQGR